jgi:hypothetical protein
MDARPTAGVMQMPYFWLGREAEDIEPYCDGDMTDMECIEGDGFITCYFSGPVQPIQD